MHFSHQLGKKHEWNKSPWRFFTFGAFWATLKLHTNYLHIFGLIHSNFNIHFLSYCWKLRFQKKIKGPVKTWLFWTNINGVQLWIVAFAIVLHKVVIIKGLHLQQFVKNGNLLKTKSPCSRRKMLFVPEKPSNLFFPLNRQEVLLQISLVKVEWEVRI